MIRVFSGRVSAGYFGRFGTVLMGRTRGWSEGFSLCHGAVVNGES